MEQLDDGIIQFHKALEINPNSAETHNNLGLALLQKGKWTRQGRNLRPHCRSIPVMKKPEKIWHDSRILRNPIPSKMRIAYAPLKRVPHEVELVRPRKGAKFAKRIMTKGHGQASQVTQKNECATLGRDIPARNRGVVNRRWLLSNSWRRSHAPTRLGIGSPQRMWANCSRRDRCRSGPESRDCGRRLRCRFHVRLREKAAPPGHRGRFLR